jgi:hypothetical protein
MLTNITKQSKKLGTDRKKGRKGKWSNLGLTERKKEKVKIVTHSTLNCYYVLLLLSAATNC